MARTIRTFADTLGKKEIHKPSYFRIKSPGIRNFPNGYLIA